MNMKFIVESPEQFNEVQKQLLKLGHKWKYSGDMEIEPKEGEAFIYVDDCIHFGCSSIAYEVYKGEEKTLADLIAMNRKDDGLISGDEAFMAWYNGDEIEVCYIPHNTWVNFNENTYGIPVFKSEDHKFRLKPKTVTINGVEINKCRSIENDRQSHEVTIEFKNQDDADEYHDLISKLFFNP